MVEPCEQEHGIDVYKNGGVPTTITCDAEKIQILSTQDSSAVTFCIRDEDHTLGNALRYIIMKK